VESSLSWAAVKGGTVEGGLGGAVVAGYGVAGRVSGIEDCNGGDTGGMGGKIYQVLEDAGLGGKLASLFKRRG